LRILLCRVPECQAERQPDLAWAVRLELDRNLAATVRRYRTTAIVTDLQVRMCNADAREVNRCRRGFVDDSYGLLQAGRVLSDVSEAEFSRLEFYLGGFALLVFRNECDSGESHRLRVSLRVIGKGQGSEFLGSVLFNYADRIECHGNLATRIHRHRAAAVVRCYRVRSTGRYRSEVDRHRIGIGKRHRLWRRYIINLDLAERYRCRRQLRVRDDAHSGQRQRLAWRYRIVRHDDFPGSEFGLRRREDHTEAAGLASRNLCCAAIVTGQYEVARWYDAGHVDRTRIGVAQSNGLGRALSLHEFVPETQVLGRISRFEQDAFAGQFHRLWAVACLAGDRQVSSPSALLAWSEHDADHTDVRRWERIAAASIARDAEIS
jgi:hypothetical protein